MVLAGSLPLLATLDSLPLKYQYSTTRVTQAKTTPMRMTMKTPPFSRHQLVFMRGKGSHLYALTNIIDADTVTLFLRVLAVFLLGISVPPLFFEILKSPLVKQLENGTA